MDTFSCLVRASALHVGVFIMETDELHGTSCKYVFKAQP